MGGVKKKGGKTAKEESGVDSAKKGGKAAKEESGVDSTKKGGKAAKEESGSKAPEVTPAQQLFGKWTGKTPVTLLNEYVQKNAGWHRVEYSMRGGPGNGFQCTVRLAKTDKKTSNVVRVAFVPEATETTAARHSSALEARHVSATYALHRLRSNTNMHRLLPPLHRVYWLELEAVRPKHAQWMYAQDPFAAVAEREREQTARDAARARRSEREERARQGHGEELLGPAARRRWEELPEVRMGADSRALVEDVVRTWTDAWGLDQADQGGSGDGRDRGGHRALVRMGFREAHVDEAYQHAHTQAQALDWLCVHVPEDDLPAAAMTQHAHVAPEVVGERGADELGGQLAAKRVARAGFATARCTDAVLGALARGQSLAAAEASAAYAMHARLFGRKEALGGEGSLAGENPAIAEELEALDAIYAGEGRVTQGSAFQVSVDLRPADKKLCPKDAQLVFWFPPGLAYPDSAAPAVGLASDNLPAYLKLHVARQLDGQLVRGDGLPMMFEAVSQAEAQVEEWLANPPPLVGLLGPTAESVSQRESRSSTPQSSQRGQRGQGRRRGRQTASKGDVQRLCDEFTKLQTDAAYQKMLAQRARLPAAAQRAQLVTAVQLHRCVVVAGGTATGKKTQVPQFILDDALNSGQHVNIVCTQPRRLSAISVAERVASERVGGSGLVGYAVRGESRRGRDTRLLYCTTGVLLRMLGDDTALRDITHVICDEVHERSVDSDLLLALLRRCLARHPQLHVILMSATAQSDLFASYFEEATGEPTSIVSIPGLTFPVDDIYLDDFATSLPAAELPQVFGTSLVGRARAKLAEADCSLPEMCLELWEQNQGTSTIDFELAAAIVRHIHATADPALAVLVFMPGLWEIQKTISAITQQQPGLHVLPLHAGLTAAEQQRVFGAPKGGQRKVVVSTNVAETSITIEDIGFVVDCGRVREARSDHQSRVSRLVTAFCSRAAAMQRRGRAGRRQRGVCYRLYTRALEMRAMPAHSTPEIQRMPLEQVCLQAKALGHADAAAFLRTLLDPPDDKAIVSAERLLVAMGVCSAPRAPLLALGRLLARIPVDLRLAKVLVFGAILGAPQRALRLVALMALDRSLFVAAGDDRDAVRKARIAGAPAAQSDWLADLAAFERRLDSKDGGGSYISAASVRQARSNIKLLRDSIAHLGLPSTSTVEDDGVLKAALVAGLSPNIARVRVPRQKYQEVSGGTISIDHEARELAFYCTDETSEPAGSGNWKAHDLRTDRRVFVHPQSTMFTASKFPVPFVAYFAQSASAVTGSRGKTYLRDVTVPGLYSLLMFGPPLTIDHQCKVLVVGPSGGLALRAYPRIGVLVGKLRELLDVLIGQKLDNPELDMAGHPVVAAVLHLIRTDGRQ